jgi:hypothetical protein
MNNSECSFAFIQSEFFSKNNRNFKRKAPADAQNGQKYDPLIEAGAGMNYSAMFFPVRKIRCHRIEEKKI